MPMAPCMRLMGFIIPVIIFNSYRCVHFCTQFAASNLGAVPLAAGGLVSRQCKHTSIQMTRSLTPVSTVRRERVRSSATVVVASLLHTT